MSDESKHTFDGDSDAPRISFPLQPDTSSEKDDDRQTAPDPEMVPEKSSEPPRAAPPPPDGGYGWVCVACVVLINAHTWGVNSSYGVFLAHYLSTNAFPGATPLQFAFVGGLSISCAMLVSPLATLSTRHFGTHVSLSVGIALQTAGLIGASFARDMWQLFPSQGVAFGLGMGFLFVASVGIPPQWFTKKRSLANGVGSSGSGFGGLVYALATGAMIRSLGLAWCFRVLGLVSFGVNVVCTVLIRDRNKLIGARHKALDLKLFRRPEYLLLNAYGFFSMLGYIALVFSLSSYGRSIGLTASQASVITAVLNLGQGLGRPPIGYFSDNVGRINMAGLTAFLCALFALVIWIFATSYGVLVFYALVGGAVAGSFWATIAPVTAEVIGMQDLPSALNLEWLVIVLPCTFSEPIALELAGSAGGYRGTQLFVGFMYFAAALCMLLLRGWKVGELNEVMKMGNGDEHVMDAADVDLARLAGRRAIWKQFWKWRKV
ncbi:mfs transporter [Diplodia corticola]|uniref:Mfs transporter n=1 Tax=Diplodia corticola TaxID=236234 RepID=A0A1J9RQ70_9PEZI|nr:mfs transporter [Diplodia corticola]OJD29701.1 mfs transporter [Diplodia corticola]